MGSGLPGLIKIPTQKWKMLVLDIGAGKTFTNWFPNFLTGTPECTARSDDGISESFMLR